VTNRTRRRARLIATEFVRRFGKLHVTCCIHVSCHGITGLNAGRAFLQVRDASSRELRWLSLVPFASASQMYFEARDATRGNAEERRAKARPEICMNWQAASFESLLHDNEFEMRKCRVVKYSNVASKVSPGVPPPS
jgi:hypothetical protein